MSRKTFNIVPNVPKYQEDPNCRWVMDALKVKKVGHGKNVRTCILNICTIAAQLNIPHNPQYISKYLAQELGSRAQWDKSCKHAEIKGVHTQEVLQQKLWGFLDVLILCPKCNKPELRHKWRKKVEAQCVACGWHGPSLRTGHRIEKFILRNPPPKKKTAKRIDVNSDYKIEAKKVVPVQKENWHEWVLGTTRPFSKGKTTEKWWEDMKDMDTKVLPKTPLGMFRMTLAQRDCKIIDVVSEFLRLETAHNLDQLSSTKLVFDACLDFMGDEDKGIDNLEASIKQNHLFLNWFTSQARADRMRSECDMMLMCYIENELVNQGLLQHVPAVLECLYDNYVFDASFFMKWFQQNASYILRDPTDLESIRLAAVPFIRFAEDQLDMEEETKI